MALALTLSLNLTLTYKTPKPKTQTQPGGQLRSHADPTLVDSLLGWEALPAPQKPLLFHGIAGKDEREARCASVAGYHPFPTALLTPLVPTYLVAYRAGRPRGSTRTRRRRWSTTSSSCCSSAARASRPNRSA